MIKMDKKIKSIIFVCLGNICRSPIAEGIAKKYIDLIFGTTVSHVSNTGYGSYWWYFVSKVSA